MQSMDRMHLKKPFEKNMKIIESSIRIQLECFYGGMDEIVAIFIRFYSFSLVISFQANKMSSIYSETLK